jgi:hypothetical protein
LVEVNQKGEVVRTYTFSYGWGIYRVVPVALQTINDYNGSKRRSDFTINLTTLNDLGGPTDIYYRINNGPTRSVTRDGQPRITMQGENNTLEYWSVDSNGIEELPHDILTGIALQKSVGSEMTTGTPTQTMSLPLISAPKIDVTFEIATIVVALVAAALFAVLVMGRRRREPK